MVRTFNYRGALFDRLSRSGDTSYSLRRAVWGQHSLAILNDIFTVLKIGFVKAVLEGKSELLKLGHNWRYGHRSID